MSRRAPWSRSVDAVYCAVCALALSTAKADPGVDVYKSAGSSVVLIRVASIDSTSTPQVNSSGSGFVVSPGGYVFTASHVVPETANPSQLVITGALGPYTSDADKRYRLKVVGRSKTLDALLLRMEEPPPGLHALSLRKSAAVAGEQLFVLGYPIGLPDVHLVDGRVSAISDVDITTNALVNHGNSGGPVLDAAGCVIGIVYSGIESHGGEVVNGIKFAVPMLALDSLLPKEMVTPPAPARSNVIHISDVLSRTQTDHPTFGDATRSYIDSISARAGYIIEAVESIERHSLNPPALQYPTPVISPDGRSMSMSYSLISGPIYDQRRGWIEMTINTRQRPEGSPAAAGPASTSCP